MTKRRYMLIDLALFALLFCLLEAASAYALQAFSGEAYAISLVMFISLLMMMRWGAYGIIYAPFGGAVYSLLHGGGAASHAIYILGGAAVAVNLLWIHFLGGRRVRDSAALTVLYCATGYIALNLGRATVSLFAANTDFTTALIRFLATDALNAVITAVFILIARKQNGLFEPQNEYLERLAKEKEEQKHGH